MLLFRSEGHVDAWLAGRAPGAVMPVLKLAELANAWWGDRLDPEPGRDRLLEQMVIGQVLLGHLLAILRRLAEEHYSARRFGTDGLTDDGLGADRG